MVWQYILYLINMRVIRQISNIDTYKIDHKTQSILLSGHNISFSLGGYTKDIVPVPIKRVWGKDNKIEEAGKKEREIIKQILLNSHINSPFSSSTASIKEFYVSTADSMDSFEMFVMDVNNKKWAIEIKNRMDYVLTAFTEWFHDVYIDKSKWDNIQKFGIGVTPLYVIKTFDDYLIIINLNDYTEKDLKFGDKMMNRTWYDKTLVKKHVGNVPIIEGKYKLRKLE